MPVERRPVRIEFIADAKPDEVCLVLSGGEEFDCYLLRSLIEVQWSMAGREFPVIAISDSGPMFRAG